MNKWFLFPVREEIDFIYNQLQKMKNKDMKRIFNIFSAELFVLVERPLMRILALLNSL